MNPEEKIRQVIHSLHFKQEPKGLYAPIEYALQTGGKRLRPMLTLIACQMFAGEQEKALPAALALELFHNFTLLHDDLMDNADTRRGKPTVYKQYGKNTAILSGDQMIIEAYKQLQELPTDKLPKVLRLFNQMATEICEGQQHDMDFEQQQEVSINDYLEMIRQKTAVMLSTALHIGAYLAGATEEQQLCIAKYGEKIGIAFQLEDDLLDVYGNPDTFGKNIGGDILEKKKTYLLLCAYQKADAALKEQLNTALNSQTISNEDKIRAVTAIYNRLGVRQQTEQLMLQYTNEAIDCLEQLSDAGIDISSLAAIAQSLLNRKQ